MSRPLKILAVGNSFSVDCMQYLAQIARACGHAVVLGNLYIGGCSLQRHYGNAQTGAKDYLYYKTTDGVWTETPAFTLEAGLGDEDWDIVVMQQASHDSGIPETYVCLPALIGFIRTHLPEARLFWNMTWAYQQGSTHAEFPRYVSDQTRMYTAIVDCIGRCVDPLGVYETIIPTGTAVQNARGGFLGDTLTRDGYHLDLTTGRLLAGMTWYAAITGQSTGAISFNPAPEIITPRILALLQESAANALAHPRTVTPSVL